MRRPVRRVGLVPVLAEVRAGSILVLMGVVIAALAREVDVYLGVRGGEAEDDALVMLSKLWGRNEGRKEGRKKSC